MLRPFPGKNLDECMVVFNYRLSKARRIVEMLLEFWHQGVELLTLLLQLHDLICSFIQLMTQQSCRWHLFRRPIIGEANNVVTFTKAAIALHNFLKQRKVAHIVQLAMLMEKMVVAI